MPTMHSFIAALLFFGSVINASAFGIQSNQRTDTSKAALIKISPETPLIEKDIFGVYLSFDIIIKNQSKHVLDLTAIELSVLDNTGKLLQRKFMNRNGQTMGMEVLGNTIIKPGESIHIANPFQTFTPDVYIGKLKYGFFFNYSDNQQQRDINKRRLAVDYDASVVEIIKAKEYVAKTNFFLPLKGRLIVWDGHDLYSRHRRFSTALPEVQATGVAANSNRYSYDLICIDGNGSMYQNSPFKKQNWFAYGKPVYAPAAGRVVEMQNNVPDNDYNGKVVKGPAGSAEIDPRGMGNHIVIDHGNGEYSILLHMEQGSINVRVGQMIKVGQQVGIVGFSGDAIYPHLHYSVMNGAKEVGSEGIPSYFNSYKLYRGTTAVSIKRSRIDTGDIIESEK